MHYRVLEKKIIMPSATTKSIKRGERGMLHFNTAMRDLIAEIVRVLPEFHNINPEQLLISASRSKQRKWSGVLAYVVPLKFREGSPVERQIRGKHAYHYVMEPLKLGSDEILYIVNFVLPRFFNLNLRDKLETVIHELYHINPDFNGDFRRLKGRSYLHGNSMKEYDQRISDLTDAFLAMPHNSTAYDFLRYNMRQTEKKFGKIEMSKVREPKPKLLKVCRIKHETLPNESLQTEFWPQ